MPSRKRLKGKARRAKAASEESKNDCHRPQKQPNEQGMHLMGQLFNNFPSHVRQPRGRGRRHMRGKQFHQLLLQENEIYRQLHEFDQQQMLHPLFGDSVVQRSANECNHGLPLLNSPVHGIVDKQLITAFADADIQHPLRDVKQMLVYMHGNGLSDVWRDADNRNMIKDQIVSFAVGYLVESQACDIKLAICLAALVLSLEMENNYDLSKGDTAIMAQDLVDGGERELTKFFKKRIQCSCLDEKWKQVKKRQPKLGVCVHCNQQKRRSELMLCTRCRAGQYCSKECQLADVPRHKDCCMRHAGPKGTKQGIA